MSQTITTRIPMAAEHVHVLRAVASGVASSAGGSVDDIADLRLLVDEAATLLVRSNDGAEGLTMSLATDRGLEITITALSPGSPPPSTSGLAWNILVGLADRVEALETPEGPAIRIVPRLGS